MELLKQVSERRQVRETEAETDACLFAFRGAVDIKGNKKADVTFSQSPTGENRSENDTLRYERTWAEIESVTIVNRGEISTYPKTLGN